MATLVQGRPRRDAGAALPLVVMVLVGSTTALAAKLAVRELPPGLLPAVRFGLAGLCLLPFVGGRGVMRIIRESPGRLLVASALCVPVNQTFFLNGTQRSPTTHVALIYATCPLIVLLLAAALGQERLSPRRLVGVLVTVSGAALLALGNLGSATPGSRRVFSGDLLLVGAVLAWGGYLTVNKPLVRRHGSLPTLVGTFLIGGVLAVPQAIWSLAHDRAELAAASAGAWWSLLYLSLFVTVVALICQNQALKRLDASQVATVGNASPLLTVLWGVWLLGEALSPLLIVGGALILGGIIWTNRAERRHVAACVRTADVPRGID